MKKSENYTCLVRKFVTNITPPLNTVKEIAVHIKMRGAENDDPDLIGFPVFWDPNDTRFTPIPYHSTIEFLRQLQQFFHKFSFLVARLGNVEAGGPGGIGGDLNANQRLEGYPYIPSNVINGADRGYKALQDEEAALITCKLRGDGALEITMRSEFMNEFYIEFGTEYRKLLGFDQFLREALFKDDGTFEDPDEDIATVPDEYEAGNALHQLDERLSIDVVATLPISNRIFSKNGGEESEFVLCRFPLNDYNRFETILVSKQDRVSEKVRIREEVNVGLEDLTQQSPNSSGIFLLPGTIQEINLKLYTRYYERGKVQMRPTKMSEGYWSITLLFGKKI